VLGIVAALFWHEVSAGRLSWSGFTVRVVLAAVVLAVVSGVVWVGGWLRRKVTHPHIRFVKEPK
jgi:hypothetical protein